MWIPSKDFETLIGLYRDRSVFCRKADIEEATLSMILNRKQAPSAKTMEKITAYLGWEIDDTWKIVAEDAEPSKR